jgi:carbamoyl-phosphate synthase small subunit
MSHSYGQEWLEQDVEKVFETIRDSGEEIQEYKTFFPHVYGIFAKVVLEGEVLGAVFSYPFLHDDVTAKDIEELKKKLADVPSMNGLELSSQVSTKDAYEFGNKDAAKRVAVLDLGVKKNILRNFDSRGVLSKVFPAKTTFAEMEKWNPNGYFISNGPGDPSAMPYAVETVKAILAAGKPLFGICLGHQLLALANDIRTVKMFNGHRGLNHPVKNVIINHCEVTSQNHGFGVIPEDVRHSDKVEITHINLNDQSIEGIRVKGKKAFSVQYHPESSPGPHDSRYLFDDFVGMLN